MMAMSWTQDILEIYIIYKNELQLFSENAYNEFDEIFVRTIHIANKIWMTFEETKNIKFTTKKIE